MWAQIGNIKVEIITIFEEMEGQHGADYPQHDVLDGKPRLQWMGAKLSSYRLKFHLHCGITKSPRAQFEILKNLMDEHQAVPFVTGTGTYLGMYVVTELTDDNLFMSDKGGVIEMSGEMTLLEYVFESSQDELKLKAEAQKKALMNPALPTAVPTVIKLPTDTPSILTQAVNGVNQTVQGITNTINNATNSISSAIQTVTTPIQQILGTVTAPLNSVMQVFGNATGELTNIAGAVNTVTGGKVNINGVVTKVQGVSNTVATGVNKTQTVLGAIGSAANSMGSIIRQTR